MSERVLIAGIGRPRFGDDALGLAAAERLAECLAGTARVVTDAGGGQALLNALTGPELLVLIDAAEASAGLPPGRWVRLRYPEDAAALAGASLHDTHTMSVDAMLELAGALDALPGEVWVYALAGAQFAPETTMSPAVAAAIEGLVEEIAREVREWGR